MSNLEDELRVLIAECLKPGGVNPETLATNAPMLETLGLDSVDVLRIAVAIEEKYGVQLDPDGTDPTVLFETLGALARHIAASRQPPSP